LVLFFGRREEKGFDGFPRVDFLHKFELVLLGGFWFEGEFITSDQNFLLFDRFFNVGFTFYELAELLDRFSEFWIFVEKFCFDFKSFSDPQLLLRELFEAELHFFEVLIPSFDHGQQDEVVELTDDLNHKEVRNHTSHSG
jgi:hypothetical protein